MKKRKLLVIMATAYISLANAIDAHCASESKYGYNEPDILPSQPTADKGGAAVPEPIIGKGVAV